MIIWLASYPRSGNGLLRLMLFRVWGIKSFSVYGDAGDITDFKIAERVGHQSLGQPFDSHLYEQLTAAETTHLVKTHEIPLDAHKAIYVVRDGRSASRSFWHYRRSFNAVSDDVANLRDILLGFTPFGSWSNHLDSWNPLERPNTLLLKYERLLADPAGQIERLADFLEMPPRNGWHNNFEQLAAMEPRYFRVGAANDPQTALTGDEANLFWGIHASWMRRLGYASPDYDPVVAEVSDAVRRSLHGAVADQMAQRAGAEARIAELREQLAGLKEELALAQLRAKPNRALRAVLLPLTGLKKRVMT